LSQVKFRYHMKWAYSKMNFAVVGGVWMEISLVFGPVHSSNTCGIFNISSYSSYLCLCIKINNVCLYWS
jgi:hypothetical protein